jgi:hypothetical protein
MTVHVRALLVTRIRRDRWRVLDAAAAAGDNLHSNDS